MAYTDKIEGTSPRTWVVNLAEKDKAYEIAIPSTVGRLRVEFRSAAGYFAFQATAGATMVNAAHKQTQDVAYDYTVFGRRKVYVEAAANNTPCIITGME